ncbi:MAG: hypothetical protein LUC97_04250 [Clostridiales bacterium]|nr:hypothetical protein [Clostridiales bacterium]
MKKKIYIAAALVLISTLNITGLTACASEQTSAANTETEAAAPADNGERQPMNKMGVMAKVTAVNGSTLTIIEAENSGRGGRGGKGLGEAPEKPEGELPEMPEGEAPEMTEGEAPEMPEGEMPEMKFEGEEKTITAADSIIFTEDESGEKTQASLSDITEGTIIMITYEEDGTTPSEIIIRR